LALVIPVLISPILTRLFTPHEFGLIALYAVFVGIVLVLSSARYEQAILLPSKKVNAVNIVYLAMMISTFTVLCLLVVILFFGEFVAEFILGDKELVKLLYFAPMSVFFLSIYQILNYWAIRNSCYKLVAKAKISQAIIISVLHVGFGYLGFGVVGLVVGALVGQLFTMLIMLYNLNIYNEKEFVNTIKIYAVLRRYKNFPLMNLLSAILNTVSVKIPLLMFGGVYGVSVVGFYSLAERVVTMPVSLVGASVAQVYYREVANFKNDLNKIAAISISVFKKMFLIGVVGMSFLGFYGDVIFAFVFGEDWRDAGVYAQYLTPWMLLVFAASPILHLYAVLEKQKIALVFNVSLFLSRFLSVVLAVSFSNSAIVGVIAFSLISVVFWLMQLGYLFSLIEVSMLKISSFMVLVVSVVLIPQLFLYNLIS